MNRRSIKMCAVAGASVALTGVLGATAWADSFTPAIEEPTFEFKLPQGPALGPNAPGGNSSSAQGRSGSDLGYDPYGYDAYEGADSSDDEGAGARSLDGNRSSAESRDGRDFRAGGSDESSEEEY